jgi:hypothetical protein
MTDHVAPDDRIWTWVELLGGPSDGEMTEWLRAPSGKVVPMWEDTPNSEGIYWPVGRAVSGLPVVLMQWRELPAGERRPERLRKKPQAE